MDLHIKLFWKYSTIVITDCEIGLINLILEWEGHIWGDPQQIFWKEVQKKLFAGTIKLWLGFFLFFFYILFNIIFVNKYTTKKWDNLLIQKCNNKATVTSELICFINKAKSSPIQVPFCIKWCMGALMPAVVIAQFFQFTRAKVSYLCVSLAWQ